MPPLICPSCGSQTPRLAVASGAPITCMKCRATFTDEAPPAGEGDSESPPQPGYQVLRFHPTRGGPEFGVFVALVVGLVSAVVLGSIAAIIRQFFWIVLLFPAGFGAALGYSTSAGAWITKCRQMPMVHGAGVVVGCVGAFTMHFVMYLIAVVAHPQLQGVGFFQYLDLRCQAGVMGFGYTGTAIYYGIEAALIVLVTAGISAELLNGPFCEKCNAWKQKEKHGPFRINATVAAYAVGAGHPQAMVAPPDAGDSVTLEIFRCPSCGNRGPVDVRATCTKTEGKNTATATTFVTYPGEATADFEAALQSCATDRIP